ncbi:uncharacterized protein LOC126682040, partial [Mercurialis annua]|uniref:uncharacterized protein LOC126682040 n=1 Tax=Mercurialis annua TaxID=3986 RepID=UPI0024AD27BF
TSNSSAESCLTLGSTASLLSWPTRIQAIQLELGFQGLIKYYASYPAGTELLTDTTKLYKAALGNCFESEEWSPIEYCIMAKHFERQGKSPYAYHAQYMAHLLSHGELDGSG